ncbi:MAG: hypothetical protein M3O09_02315, partial [Acidobacteriota bacterium]|nr:hypothetical protein [Acidobacteriota bacterium]
MGTSEKIDARRVTDTPKPSTPNPTSRKPPPPAVEQDLRTLDLTRTLCLDYRQTVTNRITSC